MATRKRKTRSKPTRIGQTTGSEPADAIDYPIRPGSQASEIPLDEQFIDEWEAENPETIDPQAERSDLLGDADRLDESAGAQIHADDFRQIKLEEFDEFDSLMDDDPLPHRIRGFEADPAQMRLAGLDEVDDLGQFFDDDPSANPSAPYDESPVNFIEEDEYMESENRPSDRSVSYYPVTVEDPQPNF